MTRPHRLSCLASALILLTVGLPRPGDAQSPDSTVLNRTGRVAHTLIDETSGIVRSRWQENVWWVHNDSGDAPRIFAID
ncbi:hypothetical protein GGQ15_003470, partial [Salinibacter ruber]|nr:hypothetical protein [Salinibacter ruber]